MLGNSLALFFAVFGRPTDYRLLGLRAVASDRPHLFIQSASNRFSEKIGGLDDGRKAAPIIYQFGHRHLAAQVPPALREFQNVAPVRTAPLVDGLVAVTDDTKLHQMLAL